MAKAMYHSCRGEKSALILVKANEFVFNWTPVYVPRQAVFSKLGVEDAESADKLSDDDKHFIIPDGYSLTPIVDPETGEVRTTKDGINVLNTLTY